MVVNKTARIELRKYEFERRTFTGEFIRFGHTNNFVTTVLLHDVKDESGETVASHIWLNKAKPFYGAKLNHGDIVQFTGLVTRYKKGTSGKITDFNIRYPSNVRNISDELECQVQY
jgi:hypothetical protein